MICPRCKKEESGAHACKSSGPREILIHAGYAQESLEVICEMQQQGHQFNWYIEKTAYDELELKLKRTDEQNKRLRVDSKLERAQQAEAKLSIAIEALEFYGEESEGVRQVNVCEFNQNLNRFYVRAHGERAREALEKINNHSPKKDEI